MPDSVIQVKGLAELEATLRNLTEEVAYKSVKRGAMAGGEVFRKEASVRAPVGEDHTIKHGKKAGQMAKHLFQSIFKKLVKDKKSVFDGFTSGSVHVKIGWRKKAFWGMFQEFGTSLMSANPFMRPAFDGKRKEALDKFIEQVKVGIRKFAK